MSDLKPYPKWVCFDCGNKVANGKGNRICTCHEGKCDVCGEIKTITHVRDFGYPSFEGCKRDWE